LKIQNLNALRGKEVKATSPAAKAVPAVSPATQPHVEPHKRSLAEDERRRTQRVLLRVRASIHVALQGQAKTFDVATLSVNPHGAVVVMNQNLPAETRLVLEHAGTKERVTCKVARPPRPMAEGYHVPLEFDPPAPDFWKIDFPPSDWRPENLF
jgi:hypothetical protein